MIKSLVAVVLALTCTAALAVPVGNISTVAGGSVNGDGGPVASAGFDFPFGFAFDPAGNLYVSEIGGSRVRKVSSNGIVTTIAGTGVDGVSGDGGPALAANIEPRGGLAADSAGNVYFSESDGRVRRLDAATGVLTVFAGNGASAFSGDGGPATQAGLSVTNIAIAADGSVLIADGVNHRVRRIAGGIITTVAGSGQVPAAGSDLEAGIGGAATDFNLTTPSGLTTDAMGGFYLSDRGQARIRHVDAAGVITTIAGRGTGADGTAALDAALVDPWVLGLDGAGNLFVVDNYALRKIDTAGVIHKVAGASGDSTWANSTFHIGVDPAGNVFFALSSQRLGKVDPAGNVSAASATLAYGAIGDGGPAVFAHLDTIGRPAVAPTGEVYVAEFLGPIRKIDINGTINPFIPGSTVATDPNGTLVIVDAARARIQRVDAAGNTTTIAGTGTAGNSGDGLPATQAMLQTYSSATFDPTGNLYFWQASSAVRKIDVHGIISTFAGNGSGVYGGDGGPATLAGLSASGIASDAAGNLYIADLANYRVRKVDTNGIISTVAGTGVYGFSGDGGPATSAQLGNPTDVAVDDDGRLYIADEYNHRIRRVETDGTISTIAGTGIGAFGAENVPAATSPLLFPFALLWDHSGYLYVVENSAIVAGPGERVRRIWLGHSTPDAFAFTALQGVAKSTVLQSETVTPIGYDSPAAISVTSGEYSIGCNGAFTSAVGTIAPGQSVCVRHTSASIGNATVLTTLKIGATFGRFRSTTALDPGSMSIAPAAIDFGPNWTNYASASQTVTVTNIGPTSLTVQDVSASADYALDHDCTTLSPGASCTVHVYFVPLGPGTRAATLVVRNNASSTSMSLIGVGERSLTRHYYEAILGRAPDEGGFAFWESEAQRMSNLGANLNETWFAMAMSFFSSAEYAVLRRDDRGFVTDLYRTFFNREPDAGGLDYWSGLVSAGMPRGVALASFMFSPEFTSFATVIFGNTRVRGEIDMVTDFYRGLLGRLPDNSGFAHWLAQLRQSQCAGGAQLATTAGTLARQFVTSPEYVARRRSDADFIGDLYNAFLRRGGDLPGVQYWLQQAQTRSRESIVADFTNSPEFQARTQAVAAEGCIPTP